MNPIQRIVLGIEYDGSGFAGWQTQAGQRTVQSVVEQALSRVANQPVKVYCAGRTDSGVHALEQVLHFDTAVERSLYAWMMGGNHHLPDDVRILWAKPAIGDFHARYSALARWYRYVILNRPMKSALSGSQSSWFSIPLDAEKMHDAAQALCGHHDFSSFRAQGCQSKSPQRWLYFIEVQRQNQQIIIDLCANAFLHHMVRNIVGALLAIGVGQQPATWTQQLLVLKNRSLAGVTAAPQGLHLAAVYYPEIYGLKKHPIFARLPTDVRRFD
jgi:tRNA pseudouridine38-40 synthase